MSDEQYPKEFLRGLPNKDCVENGHVLSSAFQFKDTGRDDGFSEASINWLDDDEAITLILEQVKDNGKIQFSEGAARIDLDYAKMVLHNYFQMGFSYERAPLEKNKYHGNLLLSNSLPKRTRQMITNGLALAAGTNIIPQTNTV